MNCRTALEDKVLILDLDQLQRISGQSIVTALQRSPKDIELHFVSLQHSVSEQVLRAF